MANLIDISGVRVGMVTVIGRAPGRNGARWRCLCDCGAEFERSGSSLRKAMDHAYIGTSCGCRVPASIDARIIAKNKGHTRYFTGNPCKHGHIAERLVSSRGCVECARIKDVESRPRRMEYFKDYHKRNPDKTKAAQDKWRAANVEKRRASDKERRQNPEHKKRRAAHQRARSQRQRAAGCELRAVDIDSMLDRQRWKCATCEKKLSDYHVDHIVPIARGGTGEPGNLQILCPTCNMKKGAKDPIEWANLNGKLL